MVKFGTKKVFLPNFTLALVRTTHLPPNFAQFIVPLNINKLDLKDYLYHAYGVECLSVRSYVEQQKIRNAKPHQDSRRVEWYRPRAIKKMTVELAVPFVYPEEPTDLAQWSKEIMEKQEKMQKMNQQANGPDAEKRPSSIRTKIRKQVEELLSSAEAPEPEKDIKRKRTA